MLQKVPEISVNSALFCIEKQQKRWQKNRKIGTIIEAKK